MFLSFKHLKFVLVLILERQREKNAFLNISARIILTVFLAWLYTYATSYNHGSRRFDFSKRKIILFSRVEK